ncbi:MAG TPA: mechanosensitive ion channel domain-containing protein [Polyangiales bacterium]|jgi:small-conductance mechanosensitive channel|nr:mechanosensitive ion channel domain-containing protein [Polyangiales bacterium]
MNATRPRAVAWPTLTIGFLLTFASAPASADPTTAGAAAPLTAAKPVNKGAEVKLHDAVVFRVWVDHAHESAILRASVASQALERALDSGRREVRVEPLSESRVVYVADTPVIELYPEDARATGSASIDLYAAKIAYRVREAFDAEQRRTDIASTVFSISLVVFFGLIALYVLRKIGELSRRAREAMLEHPERIGSVRLNKIEVIGAAPLRALLLASVILGRWVLQASVVYIWLVLSLSRFDATRPLTTRLTNSLLGPIASLGQRALSALPLGVMTLALAVAIYVVLRFVELFFAGVSRGQERASWVPRDLVTPTSELVRIGIVLVAVIFAGPALTGDPESVLAKLGSMVLLALALASTPLLASAVLGVVTIYSRRLRVGRLVELGDESGRVVSVGVLDVVLRGSEGTDVRVPHLYSLLRPSKMHGIEPRLAVEIAVSSASSPDLVQRVLLDAANSFGTRASVELADIDAEGALYVVSIAPDLAHAANDLRLALVVALQREGVPFGQRRGGRAP